MKEIRNLEKHIKTCKKYNIINTSEIINTVLVNAIFVMLTVEIWKI